MTPARAAAILARMDITVRRAEPQDFEGIWRNFSDESAYGGTLQLPYPSREAWRKRLAEPAAGHYILVACSGEQIVGNAGLHPAGGSPRRAHAMAIGMSEPKIPIPCQIVTLTAAPPRRPTFRIAKNAARSP